MATMLVRWVRLRTAPRPVESAWGSNSRTGLAVLCVTLILACGLMFDNFLTVGNAFATLLNVSSISIAAIGTAGLLISGNIDLSIGGMYALVSVATALVARDTQSAALAVAAALTLGGLLGAMNGFLVRSLKISPLIVTIGTAAVMRGTAYVLNEGISVFGFPETFIAIGRTYLGPVPVPVLIGGLVFVLGGILLRHTVAGLRIYAIGGNAVAARLAGINTSAFVTGLYALNGVVIGLVALLTTARLGSGTPAVGLSFEFDVLTAVILGGVSFAGGLGHPVGVFIGVATIAVLNTGLIFAGLQDWYQQIARGFVLLLALASDQYATYRREHVVPPDMDGEGRQLPILQMTKVPPTFEALATHAASAQPTCDRNVVFTCTGLSKSYGSVRAVRKVSFSLYAGEVTCLVGDNGAGKSTVIKMISGAIQPDEGTMELCGNPQHFSSPADARAAGIETVYQDLALCPNLGAAYNLVLGKEPVRIHLGPLSLRNDHAAEEIAKQRLSELGIVLDDYRRPVGHLSGGQRQSVAIARVAGEGVSLVILDEPTAALGVSHTKNVLRLIRAIAERNTSVLMITHDIDTVYAIADRVIVLRLGHLVFDGPIGSVTQAQLVQLMAGFIPDELRDRLPEETLCYADGACGVVA
jgi:ribose/xylose/arabinose/galactoside ABC-type transport system permease subunit/ABC-type multidrug transport system ATPase subunit